MKTLGNIIWHIPFLGFINAIIVYLCGLLLTVLVITAPIGLGLMEYGKFLFMPFGNHMIDRSELDVKQNELWQAYGCLVTIIYFPIGLILAITAIFQVVAYFVSILGIPLAIILAKSLGVILNPVNKVCVPDEILGEIEARRGQQAYDRYHRD